MILIIPNFSVFFRFHFIINKLTAVKKQICSPVKRTNILASNVAKKGYFAEHQREVHEGVKYPCIQYGKQFSQRGSLARHQGEAHEGVKFPCRQCGKQFSQMESQARHQREVHEGFKYPCGRCSKQFSKTKTWLGTKGQYMKESNTLAADATVKPLQREVLLNT